DLSRSKDQRLASRERKRPESPVARPDRLAPYAVVVFPWAEFRRAVPSGGVRLPPLRPEGLPGRAAPAARPGARCHWASPRDPFPGHRAIRGEYQDMAED